MAQLRRRRLLEGRQGPGGARGMDRHARYLRRVHRQSDHHLYPDACAVCQSRTASASRSTGRGSSATSGNGFGMQDIEIGDPQFDEDFIIKGTDESQVRALLSHPKLRELIAAAARHSLHGQRRRGLVRGEVSGRRRRAALRGRRDHQGRRTAEAAVRAVRGDTGPVVPRSAPPTRRVRRSSSEARGRRPAVA